MISATHPWIAVSPDLIVQCDCHGRGVVEIKCPVIKNEEKPNSDNYKHLEKMTKETIAYTEKVNTFFKFKDKWQF